MDIKTYTAPHIDCEVNPEPKLVVLNFSGGKQSSAILWMLIRDEVIPRPENLVCLTADPGMENSQTYDYIAMMREHAEAAGIEMVTAPGPSLFDDIMSFKAKGRTRLDNPPYWTKHPETGKEGKLRQGCTRYYKIEPMDRAMRLILEERHGISRHSKRLGNGIVEKWIGFSADEFFRIKEPAQKYVQFHYPLMMVKYGNDKVLEYFRENDLPIPPRSVCNACFANGVDTLKDMHDNRPDDWAQAVAVDEMMRDSSLIGVDREVYVSKTLIPLKQLAAQGFKVEGDDADGYSCDSGMCFT